MKERVCSVEGCNGKHYGKGYCNKHYQQVRKNGKILKRTIFDLNEFVIYDTYAEIVLYDKDCNEKARALIDVEDVEKVKNMKWCEGNNYVHSQHIFLHRFILDCPSDMVVDHINHNPLDNRKSNLRICTQQENSFNKKKMSNNTSGVIGVWWRKDRNKWIAQIRINGKIKTLGHFDTPEQAIEVRKKAEIEYFGEYRNIN